VAFFDGRAMTANGGGKFGHGSGGVIPLRAAQWSSTFVLPAFAGEGGRIITVDMYRKVRWRARRA
jgi:hypothetical protein